MRPRVMSRDEWTTARVALLAQEKELTRLRDAISRQRRELPWVADDEFDVVLVRALRARGPTAEASPST
jgi:predicted dithiol-disulfide oxidoreductase (DUF899 family)